MGGSPLIRARVLIDRRVDFSGAIPEPVAQGLLARSKRADVGAVRALLCHLAEDLAEKLKA